MTRRSLANVAQSVHQRLLTRAQETHRPFNELLQRYDEGLLTEPKGTVGGALPKLAEEPADVS